MANIEDTLAPKSSQLDAVDLLGGPRVFTVESVDVKKGAEQPVDVHLAEFDRPWRPGVNQRRVLGFCWGKESDGWIGHRVELFCDAAVQFGGKAIGGTRIKRLSHIDGPKNVPVLNGKKSELYRVDPLPDATPADRTADLRAEWKTADPDRKKAIEAEVNKLSGGQA